MLTTSEEAAPNAAAAPLSNREFAQFQAWLHRAAGISLSPAKKALVCGRLRKRLLHYRLASYGEYFRLLMGGEAPGETQVALDLLTTNETYFFREPKHFDYLRDHILPAAPGGVFRVWSAACSTGEEPYSVAMLLADRLKSAPWEVVASDISLRVLAQARSGHYGMARVSHIPKPYLQEYCLKGIGPQEGTFVVEPALRAKVSFRQVNLNENLPRLPEFNLVFLRNVMIYFDADTKRRVVERLIPAIKPGGHLFIGHSESLHGITDKLQPVMPSIYRKP